jgi:hypothetical protein
MVPASVQADVLLLMVHAVFSVVDLPASERSQIQLHEWAKNLGLILCEWCSRSPCIRHTGLIAEHIALDHVQARALFRYKCHQCTRVG